MTTTTATRRLAAILAADVVGYSRLMGADEEGTHERLKAHLREVVDPQIREHRGRIVKTTGDGVLAEFASVVDAVRCAAEIQRAMADRDLDLAEERRLRFRIGVNLGDVIADEGDIYGDGVNIATRLEGLAAPGGICISGTARDHIGDRLPYAFADMGEQSVKNIAQPVRVYALRPKAVADLRASPAPIPAPRRRWSVARIAIATAAAAVLVIAIGARWLWPMTKPGPTSPVAAATSIAQPLAAPRLSIVVLPFANLSNDPDQQYFADGITEDLTTDVSRITDMFVIARSTAFTYRDKAVDVKQIGHELGVRYVLEGSLQRFGNQVRITAQLIGADTDSHLWAERFDRDRSNLIAVQNEITGRIAVALSAEMIGAEASRRTENPDAVDYILRGRAALLKPLSRETYAEAIDMYERALALDPDSVDAQSSLAGALGGRVLEGMTDSRVADIKRVEQLAEQALKASPRSASAHYAMGQVLRVQNRFEAAIPEYEAAVASNRNSVTAISAVAECKLHVGPIEEVIPLQERALRLSPRDSYVSNMYSRMGAAHLLQSHIDEAIVWLEKARDANPVRVAPHALLASAYALDEEAERAATELAEARRLIRDDRFSSIARLKVLGAAWGPKIRPLVEATYWAGLRKAGVPEE